MTNEADTCRKFVVPKLQSAGWDNDPHSIAEQRTIGAGFDALLASVSAPSAVQAGTVIESGRMLPAGLDKAFKVGL